ncbi:NUDIX hydrolase [Aeoliella mucimassa]|uniref:GDP-mannose pyrophosphatase n=1 Tax=Aeoliella mucimassa TaxID=2527972 RepID=A0A518AUB0_9BACT|nr:NUDIX hydrolase [Aeoliella mucimassa]QDU58320.1 ADP-ribose pyrophosphatase [Aeoliella mucimassa]
MDQPLPPPECLHRGKHLTLVARGHWEYAVRTVASGAVGILAITSDEQVVLVEQYRIPVGRPVIEIPAGLVGDTAEFAGEPLIEAAKRELLEETGYVSDSWSELGSGYSSPGLSDESIMFFLAADCRKESDGGGDDFEDIRVHTVPLAEVDQWLDSQQAAGIGCDFKLFASLRMAEKHRQQ